MMEKWKTMSVMLSIKDAKTDEHLRTVQTTGRVLGPLGVCPAVSPAFKGRLAVFSLATSDAFCCVTEEPTARKIVEHLLKHCRNACAQLTKSEIVLRLPQWAFPWLKACEAGDRWLDPKDYMKG